MEITITAEKENKLIGRRELTAKIVFDKATPSRKDLQKEVAKAAKSNEKLTIIETVKTDFGGAFATLNANIYADEKVMLQMERKNLIEKHAGWEPKKEEGEE